MMILSPLRMLFRFVTSRLVPASVWLLVLALGAWYLTLLPADAREPKAQVPYEELRLLSDIYAQIKKNYVDEKEDKDLFEGAIHGMLRSLDPYSVYLTKKEYSNLKTGTTGKFGGLGIEVSKDEDYIFVNRPIPNTPASRAGIQSGDLIVAIDGKSAKGMSVNEGVDLMRGEVNTSITLKIKRDKLEPFDVSLTRAVIKRDSVRFVLLDDDIAYATISNFQMGTGNELAEGLEKLQKENQGRAFKGIILDLRGNPGGVLNEAVTVADVFLDAGKMVVYTQGRIGSPVEYKTQNAAKYANIPLLVMIDQRSASASEIVSGALKDHARASLLGSKTFGKASVQTIHPIDDKRALKLTTARYYTPQGHMIQGKGIEPHIAFSDEEFNEQMEKMKQRDGTAGMEDKDEIQKTRTAYLRKQMRRGLGARIKDDWQVQRAVKELQAMRPTAQQNLPATQPAAQ